MAVGWGKGLPGSGRSQAGVDQSGDRLTPQPLLQGLLTLELALGIDVGFQRREQLGILLCRTRVSQGVVGDIPVIAAGDQKSVDPLNPVVVKRQRDAFGYRLFFGVLASAATICGNRKSDSRMTTGICRRAEQPAQRSTNRTGRNRRNTNRYRFISRHLDNSLPEDLPFRHQWAPCPPSWEVETGASKDTASSREDAPGICTTRRHWKAVGLSRSPSEPGGDWRARAWLRPGLSGG